MSDASTPTQVVEGSVSALMVGIVLWFAIKYLIGPVTPEGRARHVRWLASPVGRIFQWGVPAVFVVGGVGGLVVALVAALAGAKTLGG